MNNKFSFIYFLPIVLLFGGCKKFQRNCIDAHIIVREKVKGLPVANAMVIIKKGAPSSFTGNLPVDTVYTDNNGFAHYELKQREEGYMYYAFAYHDDFIPEYTPYGLNALEHQNVIMEYYQKGYVKLHVKNVNPFGVGDQFHIAGNCGSWNFIGATIDTTILFCDYGINNSFFSYIEYRSGGKSTKNNIDYDVPFKFTPIPHDTITIDVNY
ncbi:MAG: hypothetical protein IPO27_06940 [Bacteroidetes bacterium]|nr:hypothetical protein [Bacteroidota bacterium]